MLKAIISAANAAAKARADAPIGITYGDGILYYADGTYYDDGILYGIDEASDQSLSRRASSWTRSSAARLPLRRDADTYDYTSHRLNAHDDDDDAAAADVDDVDEYFDDSDDLEDFDGLDCD